MSHAGQPPEWKTVDNHHLARTFTFPDFQHALDFVNRIGALAALGQSLNLLIGLSREPSGWPWSYIMLAGYAVLFLSTHPGRVFGVDGWLARHLKPANGAEQPWVKTLGLIT